MTSGNPFRLKKVCGDCPFRCDVPFEGLSSQRVAEIAASLRGGATFHCHKTLDYDDEGDPVVESSQMCAGALATMEWGREPNQAVLIAERLGLYDPDEFDWESQPVHEGLDRWEAALGARARLRENSRT